MESGQGQGSGLRRPDAGYAQSGYASRARVRATRSRPRGTASPVTPGRATRPAARSRWRTRRRQAPTRAPTSTSQPWDYDQPLRYEGEDDTYQARYDNRYAYGPQDNGAVRYQPPAYDPAAYNGSDYSMPGVNGPGYDLSGIIGTSDFEAVGYDEPSYGRLSYDDPRYDDPRAAPNSGPTARYDETRVRRAAVRRHPARQPVAARRRRPARDRADRVRQ